jgi:imidazolonepropionase
MMRAITCDRLVTNDGPAIDDGALVLDGARVAWVGARAEMPPEHRALAAEHAPLVTPGLVDAHTHAAWAGSRHAEYAMRMAGADYVAIANAGGGILGSHRAIEATSEDDLALALEARLRRMATLGVTTVEVKSGYGLLPELELKQLRAIARVATRQNLPRVVPTFLALHALAPGETDRDRYAQAACALAREVGARKLARFVDAYVDEHAFHAPQARALGAVARDAGLGVRLHVGQFSDIGGAELAAELGARSADHLEHVSEAGAHALAAAGVFAVMLPVAAFTLAQAPPDVALLRRVGVPLVVASDANPGTAPTESLPLAMALAVRSFGLTPNETLAAVTTNAARSLDVDTGILSAGARADVVLWDLPHEIALVQPWGTPRASLVLRDGAIIARA